MTGFLAARLSQLTAAATFSAPRGHDANAHSFRSGLFLLFRRRLNEGLHWFLNLMPASFSVIESAGEVLV